MVAASSDIRVHVITPIVTEGFRTTVPCVPKGCILTVGQIENGPASIESAVDEVLAAPGIVDAAIRAERDGAQAIVIDCMLDPGLEAAREVVSVPVIGCGEAAMRNAGAAFSIVTVLQRQERAFVELSRKYGLGPNLLGVRSIGVPVLALETEFRTAIDATIRESRAAARAGAGAIVFGCTGMLGFAEPVGAVLSGVAVIDPLPNAISRAREMVAAGSRTDKTLYPSPEPKRVAGFEAWEELHNLMGGNRE